MTSGASELPKWIPTIEHPTREDRDRARLLYPDEWVPDEGPIPDPGFSMQLETEVIVPEWVLDVVGDRLEYRQANSDAPTDPSDATAFIVEYVQVYEHFVTPGGEPVESYFGLDGEGCDGEGEE